MTARRWKLLLAAGLALASLALYAAFFWFHPDREVIADWFLGSLAFVPFQMLLVTLIVDGLLGRREQQARLKKLNIVIGVFFSEVGMALLGLCLGLERRAADLRAELGQAAGWSPARLEEAAVRYRAFTPSAEPDPALSLPPAEPPPLAPGALALEVRLRDAGFEPPLDSELGPEASELPALRAAGRAVRVGRTLHYHPDALAEIERRVVGLIEARGSLTLAQLRDELGTSRKFAQALLEHFDAEKLTRRVGEARVLRRG